MRHYSWNTHDWGGKHASASASATKSYHNGGVEGDAFSDWYSKHLADRFNDPDEDGTGSGSGGTKGSGSGGSKGSGSGGSKGSGSGGSKGSGSGGSKGSGSGGSKGSGSGGSKGSGSGGSKGSGSGGSKGSGSGGSKGSGSGGSKGSGSGGTHGSDCDTDDSDDGSSKSTLTYVMGTDPQVTVSVTETPTGTLFFDLKPVSSDGEPADINGIFFSLTDDSELSSLVFFPVPNQGFQYSEVTGTQADANSVDTLADGSTTPGQFDAAIQFGTGADSTTNGLVNAVNFTLWSTDGPLTFEDIDLGGMTILADTEASGSVVMTVTDSDDETCDHTGGTDGSGSGGTKGSGSGGTDGSGSGSGGTKGSGSGGTDGSGSGGTKGSGSGGTDGSANWRIAGSSTGGGEPGLNDIMALMTIFPDEDDPEHKEEHDPWEDEEPEFLF